MIYNVNFGEVVELGVEWLTFGVKYVVHLDTFALQMTNAENDTTTMPKPKNPDSRWMTVDENDNIISEGKTPEEAINLAKEKTDKFTVLFVPKEGSTYIF